jgi:hypothetical protein
MAAVSHGRGGRSSTGIRPTMDPTPPETPVTPPAHEDLLAFLPRLAVALAGACTLSGVVGLALILGGYGAPPLHWLLAPPAAVLVGGVVWLRSRRRGRREEVR